METKHEMPLLSHPLAFQAVVWRPRFCMLTATYSPSLSSSLLGRPEVRRRLQTVDGAWDAASGAPGPQLGDPSCPELICRPPAGGPPQAWCWFAGLQVATPSGPGMVCRPPALVFPAPPSASISGFLLTSPAPSDPQVLSAPTLGLSHAQTPTLSVTPSATPLGKKPGAVPAPHQLCPHTDLGPTEVQLPCWDLSSPHLWGRRCASF